MKIQDGTRVLTSFSTLPHCHPICDTVGEAEACGVTLPHTVIPSWELTSMVTQGLTHFEWLWEPIRQDGIPIMQVICIHLTSWDLYHLSTTALPASLLGPTTTFSLWQTDSTDPALLKEERVVRFAPRRVCHTSNKYLWLCIQDNSKDVPSRHLCALVHS